VRIEELEESARKGFKIAGAAIATIELCLFALLFVSVYTMSASVAGIFMHAEEGMPLSIEQKVDSSLDTATLMFALDAENRGLLDIRLTLEFRLFSPTGEVIAEVADSKLISPGSIERLELVMTLPLVISEGYMNEGSALVLRMALECRTLFDLVGAGIQVQLESGGSGKYGRSSRLCSLLSLRFWDL
jgi:hypothetical protein